MRLKKIMSSWKLAALVGLFALSSCSRRTIGESLVSSSHAPAPPAALPGDKRVVLVGDLHCHVSPPDGDADVTRGFAETVELAKREKLDFVVFTPHVPSRFFLSAPGRASVAKGQADLRATIAAGPTDGVMFVPGFEYTDHLFGHVGVSFAELDAVLAELPIEEANAHPERFFERWVARGGVLIVNHPLVTPLESLVKMARYDLSWRPWTSTQAFPPEIVAIDRLAQGYEAYNVSVSELRDRFLLGDSERSIRGVVGHLDGEIVARGKPLFPAGGSDSHGHTLRATTFVLATERSPSALHDALLEGRTCVRSPQACTFEARADGGAWQPIGSAFHDVDAVEVRARGSSIDVFVNGALVGKPESSAALKVAATRGVCSVVRVRVDDGFSAPIYVNCPAR